jgi:precorrin-3B synthase
MRVTCLPAPAPSPSPQGRGEHGLRRGACPGLSAPLPTGDGLLVRIRPLGVIPLAAFNKLCASAIACGNGIMEITTRGSIQVRGLSAASAPCFADEVAALGIAAQDGVPILINPLAGLAADDIIDAAAFAVELRRALADQSFTAKLSPKISVAIDGGSALNLDAVAADVRLRAAQGHADRVLQVSVGGDAASATLLGRVGVGDGVEVTVRLLDVLAKHGRTARASDIVASEGVEPFHSAAASFLLGQATPSYRCRPTEVIGTHRLHDGSYACGIAHAFGYAAASVLQSLIQVAEQTGASGVIAAPGRCLISVGLPAGAVSDFATQAEQLGFITWANDPRRRVIACAGAPLCASGHIATRAIAPLIADAAAKLCDGFSAIHLSGCAKGCAYPRQAALTIVGSPEGCALVADGAAQDTPFVVVPTEQLPAAVGRYARGPEKRGARHG